MRRARASITRATGTVPVVAEVGRAEDRHVGGRAGILDQIADAHDLAGDGDQLLEPRALRSARRSARGRAPSATSAASGE